MNILITFKMSRITTNLMDHNLFLPFLTQVQRGDNDLDELDEQTVSLLLTEVIEKIKTENQELNIKQAQIQVTWKSVYCFGNILKMQKL